MKPMRIGLDSRSAIMPNRARPISSRQPPDSSASRPAKPTARSGLPPASGRITAAITADSVESGPSTSTRLGPNSA